MALAPKPVTLSSGANPNPSLDPQPLVVVDGGDFSGVSPQTAPTVDDTPADATAVATDLQSVVDALVAAGVFTA